MKKNRKIKVLERRVELLEQRVLELAEKRGLVVQSGGVVYFHPARMETKGAVVEAPLASET